MPQLRKAISFLIKDLKISTHEVIIHFVSVTQIRNLHKQFFKDPSATDCITFPIDSPQEKKSFHLLGEAFICPKIALEYAYQHHINPYEELSRYIIHCLLHLLGYSDIQDEERVKMKHKERRCLKKLVRAGLIPKSNLKALRQKTAELK